MSKHYIVWNENKTEGFVTDDEGLAYEVRKSADSNCYDRHGNYSDVGAEFCNKWFADNCTIEIIEK